MAPKDNFYVDLNDEVVRGAIVLHKGTLMYPPPAPATPPAAPAPPQPKPAAAKKVYHSLERVYSSTFVAVVLTSSLRCIAKVARHNKSTKY